MTPLKDTLDAVNPAAESGAPRAAAPTAKPAGHLRSDAVSLEIPIRVHGSRVTEVMRGVTPRTEPFEEQSSTMIVFPQGGVLRLTTAVTVGQMLILTNLKTRQDAICRIVKVRGQGPGLAGYVEIEFTQRQPGYWGVYFPTDGPDAARKTSSPVSPAEAEAPANGNSVSDAVRTPAPAPAPVSVKPPEAPAPAAEVKPVIPMPARVVPPAKPESSFIQLGSQESVQPAASEVPRASVVAPPRKSAVTNFPPSAPAERPAAPSRPLSMEELLADVQPGLITPSVGHSADTAEPEVAPDVVVKSSARAAYAPAHPATTAAPSPEHVTTEESFEDQHEPVTHMRAARARAPQGQGLLIAACAALLLAGAAGGYLYLHKRHIAVFHFGAARPTAVQPAPQPQTTANNVVPNPVGQPKTTLPVGSHSNLATPVNPTAAAPGQPSSPAKHAAQSMAKDILGTINAHPVASQSAASQAQTAPAVAAPVISANNDAGAPGGMASPTASVLPPSAASASRPAAATPQMTQPRLVSSTPPDYPAIAKQMRIQGDVVIKALIDPSGRVANMTVISGPTLLQEAARNALRQWKYEPSKLDGRAVPAEIQVMIRFKL